jgi:starch-binding outer membrane protein, SusD/RagB family
MKSYKVILIILISLFIGFTGCEEKVLEKEPRQFFSEVDLWNDIGLAKLYVNDCYMSLGGFNVLYGDAWPPAIPACITDESYLLFDYALWIINTGKLAAGDMGNLSYHWRDLYRYIRKINTFFENIDKLKEASPEDVPEIDELIGEMRFLRAMCYSTLINFFGGVPLITTTFQLDDDFGVPRNSYQECVDFIIAELDEALSLLPEPRPSDELGKANKGAALALKSRVLLYAASVLHDSNTQPSGPLYDYNKTGKWQDAADAALAVINMTQYSLVEVDNYSDYQAIFLNNNSEGIFARQFYPDPTFSPLTVNNIDYVNSPNGYYGWSGNCPTHNIAQMFHMKDGLSVEESPLYDPSPESIYENRELRFYADIVHDGSFFRGREAEFWTPNGRDSKDGVWGWNYARTGYTMRKFMDESTAGDWYRVTKPTTPYIIFRLAEFYLSYAEAQYHLGHEGIARDYVNIIRNRVHLPDINSSGEELLEDIRHERSIELVFEGWHRFFDLRRWMMAEEILKEDAIGIEWEKRNEQGEIDYNGTKQYKIITTQERDFKPRMLYLPIPLSEIERTDLEQNSGY